MGWTDDNYLYSAREIEKTAKTYMKISGIPFDGALDKRMDFDIALKKLVGWERKAVWEYILGYDKNKVYDSSIYEIFKKMAKILNGL